MDRIIELVQVISNGVACICYINTPGTHPVIITGMDCMYALRLNAGQVITYEGRNEIRMASRVERELYMCKGVEARRLVVEALSGMELVELVSELCI